MQLFFSQQIKNDICFLDEIESKHCIKVLRLSEGSEINIIDGIGNIYIGIIKNPNPKACSLRIKSKKHIEKIKPYIHIAIAPTKNNDRFEWFLEKATEIGIDEITPLLCDHSERKLIKKERLEKVILSAAKQSIKAYLPKLNELIPLKTFIQSADTQQKFIAHCEETKKDFLKDKYESENNVIILIGPEGDFSNSEIEAAIENNFIPISLGDSRLRTETAGIVACHTINLLNEK